MGNPIAALSDDARRQIRSLTGPRPWPFIGALIRAWAVIIAAIWASIYLDNIFFTIFAIIVVATRQNVLGLLVHDQTHNLGLNFKYGDWIVNAFAAYPLLAMSVENYSKIHLRHHQSYFSKEDPDFIRKSGPDWTYPMTRKKLFSLFLCDILGLSAIKFLIGKNKHSETTTAFNRRIPVPKGVKIGYFLTLAVIVTALGVWPQFLLYWVLPIFTVLQVIIRWGAICEHSYGYEGAPIDETSPVILLNPIEKILLPNLNFTWHPYHHYFPAISFSNLPRVHAIFEQEGLVRQDQLFHGYGEYLAYILGKRKAI